MKLNKQLVAGALAFVMVISTMSGNVLAYADSSASSENTVIENSHEQFEPELVNYEIMFASKASALVWVRDTYPNAWHFEFFYKDGTPCVRVYYDKKHRHEHFIVRCKMIDNGHCYIEK